jgi:integrase
VIDLNSLKNKGSSPREPPLAFFFVPVQPSNLGVYLGYQKSGLGVSLTLTVTACKNAKAKDKPYKMADGGGLYLLVNPNGSKYWRMKYRFLGLEKLMAFGTFPAVSLIDARATRDKAKKLLASTPPIDPMARKEEALSAALRKAENSFKAVALEWHANHKERWSEGYAQKIMRCLEINLFPEIGNKPIADITPPKLLECLRKVEKRDALDIAAKCKQISSMIFRYGIQTGKCERDAAADLKGALKTRRIKHYAAFEAKDLPKFLNALERNEARLFERTRRAIWLSLLTFQRPGEIRQAQWSEIDFDEKVWRIAADKMKMRRDHLVPLSKQAIAVLMEQKAETAQLNTDWVFPSQVRPKQPMSDGTVNTALKRLGFGGETVAHGFRALARTTIREEIGHDSEVIEKQLAHKTRNPLGEAYDRTQFLAQRTKMMQEWSDYLEVAASGGKILKGKFGKAG